MRSSRREAKKAADNALKQFGKEIKADLGKGGLQDIKDAIDLDTPEGEERLKEEMARRARVMRWMGLPIGSEPDMFGGPDRRPVTEKAFAEGKAAGLKAEPFRNPYHQTNPGNAEYAKGYEAGQKTNMAGFKQLDTEGAADSLAN